MKTKKELEYRAFNFEVKAEETERGHILTGRPIVYNSQTDLGWYYEVIERGALDNTDLTDVRFLVNHDVKSIPLARSRRNNGNSTMKMSVDFYGLNLDYVNLDTENNDKARALYSAVGRGDISGMSFMFSVDEARWEDLESDKPTRYITKISSVVEVSAVTFPAYESTEIYARSQKELESAKTVLERARSQKAKAVDTALEILKEKTKIIFGGI